MLELEDYDDEEELKFIMDAEPDDQEHCACVPILKRRIIELEKRLEEKLNNGNN